jgi:hypothetical protein
MWYQLLAISLSLSWNLTGCVIQVTCYFIYTILKPYRISDARYKLFYFPYPETLQDKWCKVLAILFSISWRLTGYVIQCTSHFFPYPENLQNMWYKVLVILFSLSWNLTGYMIKGTSYFIFHIPKTYGICDTRY